MIAAIDNLSGVIVREGAVAVGWAKAQSTVPTRRGRMAERVGKIAATIVPA